MSLPYGMYRLLMSAMHRLAPRILAGRVAKGKEHPERVTERLGVASVARPDGRLVWLHGVSVGESLSALPVIERLRTERPDLSVLVTTATTTSADILAKRLPASVIHQFAPIDTPQAAAAFLGHWRPDLAVFIESDIWPVWLTELSARHVPHVLLSARITDKTYKGWKRFPETVKGLLRGYSLIMAQDAKSEEYLASMGVRAGPRANLKTIGAPLPVKDDELATLRAAAAGRFVWLAASTHEGEEAIISKCLETHVIDGDLLVIVPRHPLRAEDIRLNLIAAGFRVAQRSNDDPIEPTTQIYLADTLGELGTFFALADLVVMGGSFMTGIGGHNPLEPARQGKCVITGADIGNWQGVYADLLEAGAGFQVQGPQELKFLASQLHAAPAAIADANAKARDVSRREDGTLDTVWTALQPLLPLC